MKNMFLSLKLALNRTALEIVNEIRRDFSKTCATRHNVVYKYYDNLRINFDLHKKFSSNFGKYREVSRYNNIRVLSTINEIKMTTTPIVSKEDNEEFTAILPYIVKDLINYGKQNDIPEVTERLANVLQQDVLKGKIISGQSAVMTYKMLEKPENLTPENIKLANILGWCTELLLNYVILTDNIIDNTKIRRDNLDWYGKPEESLQAINDATMIYSGVFELLKIHFSSLPCYIPLLELFHDSVMNTAMGKSLDTFYSENNKVKLNMFTMNRYLKIVKYKTCHLNDYLHIVSGMYLANIFDEELHRQCKTILMKMGEYVQVEDDFLDCFDSLKPTKKFGEDIRNGKCTWLAVVALERATPNQKLIMEQHYGKSEDIFVQAIRNLYEELSLPSVFAKYREDSFNLICTLIKLLPKKLNHNLMLKLTNYLYSRKY